jgi:hypothetical protein
MSLALPHTFKSSTTWFPILYAGALLNCFFFVHFLYRTSIMAEKRVAQIAGHLNYPKGMLAGQVAIITGSGQGIGAEAARLFANEGAKVIVSDIDGGEFFPDYTGPGQ